MHIGIQMQFCFSLNHGAEQEWCLCRPMTARQWTSRKPPGFARHATAHHRQQDQSYATDGEELVQAKLQTLEVAESKMMTLMKSIEQQLTAHGVQAVS